MILEIQKYGQISPSFDSQQLAAVVDGGCTFIDDITIDLSFINNLVICQGFHRFMKSIR